MLWVHKTLVQVEQKQKEERAVQMAKVLEADMEVGDGEALLRVCLQLVGQGVCPGDAGDHAALNAGL